MATDTLRSLAHIALSVTEYGLTKALEGVRLADEVLREGDVRRFLREEVGPRGASSARDGRTPEPAGSRPRRPWRDEDPGDLEGAAAALRSRRASRKSVTSTPEGETATAANAAPVTAASETTQPVAKASRTRAAATTAGGTRSTSTRTTGRKAPSKRAPAKRTPAKRTPARKAPATTATASAPGVSDHGGTSRAAGISRDETGSRPAEVTGSTPPSSAGDDRGGPDE